MSYADSQKNLTLFKSLADVERDVVAFQGIAVHPRLVAPLTELVEEARSAGFDLRVASGFRSIDRQCQIWNAKAAGLRPVLDDAGEPLSIDELTPMSLVFAILRWSALPAASRHHWGTDIDVYDHAALPAGHSLQLTQAECDGPFAGFHGWLDEYLSKPDAMFFRPYVNPLGGVAPEPWHLSFAPVATQFQRTLDRASLLALVLSLDIALKDEIECHFDEIFERFIWVRPHLYPKAWPL